MIFSKRNLKYQTYYGFSISNKIFSERHEVAKNIIFFTIGLNAMLNLHIKAIITVANLVSTTLLVNYAFSGNIGFPSLKVK